MTENDSPTTAASIAKELAVETAKSVAVTVAGTVIAAGLLTVTSRLVQKLQNRKDAKLAKKLAEEN